MFRMKITGFVSKIDEFLVEFDASHQKTEAQLAEIQKYERIINLRDNPGPGASEQKIWEDF